jgi:hypothetical protein
VLNVKSVDEIYRHRPLIYVLGACLASLRQLRWRPKLSTLYRLTALGLFIWLAIGLNVAQAAVPLQKFTVINGLGIDASVTGGATYTRVSVKVAFYNGNLKPCFSISLPYGASVGLGTGGTSPCRAPVVAVMATPLSGRFGPIWQAPTLLTIDSSFTRGLLAVAPLALPTFDAATDIIVAQGTSQIVVTPQ